MTFQPPMEPVEAGPGTEVSTYLFWGGGLLLAGLVVLAFARRQEA